MIVLDSSRKQFCARKNFPDGALLKLVYVISGENENAVKAIIENEQGTELFVKDKEAGSEFQLEIKEGGKFKVCFSSDVDTDSIVSFEFVNHLEVGPIANLATDDVFSRMNRNLTDVSEMLNDLDHALKYMVERNESHNKCNLL